MIHTLSDQALSTEPRRPMAEVNFPLPPTLDSSELLQGKSEVLIQHGETVYRLRQTRAGKLLLYK